MRRAHAKTGRVMQDGMLGVGNSCSLFRHMLLGLGWQSIRGQGGWLGPATAGTRIRCPGQVSPIGWPVSDSSGCSIVCYILQGPCSIVVELVSFWLPCVASHNGMFDNAALLLACVVLEVQATLGLVIPVRAVQMSAGNKPISVHQVGNAMPMLCGAVVRVSQSLVYVGQHRCCSATIDGLHIDERTCVTDALTLVNVKLLHTCMLMLVSACPWLQRMCCITVCQTSCDGSRLRKSVRTYVTPCPPCLRNMTQNTHSNAVSMRQPTSVT
jgi:hypothetical protein